MSDPPPPRHRGSMGRAIKKVRSVWQSISTSRRSSSSDIRATNPSSRALEPAPVAASEPISVGPQILEVDEEGMESDTEQNFQVCLPSNMNAASQSRAALLAKKYGFELSELSNDFLNDSAKPERLRVEKKIRMRSRWTCHYCQGQFGKSSICTNCDHHKCKECATYPKRRRSQSTRQHPARRTVESTLTTDASSPP